ncbi:MAG: beta-lactamase family protein [Alphaproteobacteria bacterium]|nr:beta-lactamase family protein [Alphaproteobacteria bacterium]MBU1516754.1 beta-lactamase family protein [Alphaproteobacteria bacterium]MBU2092448.1 beta-lactamase family protein [Alphaproteobacteria bacterium]MBU2152698.1 beta-lactamase family protein [Alphaproteobacteria bacterium]MBU2305632.1 beta-lactamase family protein [Alphaproteobacteria bacterium]
MTSPLLRRFALAAAATLILGAAPARAEPRLPAVDAALQPLVDQGLWSGSVVLVLKDGKVVHAAAAGKRDQATGDPMKMDTIFRAFSMTKPITAVAMMILYDEGRWKPEDPITKFLPELAGQKVFRGIGADGKPILEAPKSIPTMRELMTQTAGFSYGMGKGYVDDQYKALQVMDAPDAEAFITRLAQTPLAYEPGTQWMYSASVDVQGAIVQRITGQRLDDFMQARIFGPLKMKDTGFVVPPEKRSRFANLYLLSGGKLGPMPPGSGLLYMPYDKPPGFPSGGGGLVTTAGDYARFGQMLLNGGRLDGARIISPAAAKLMMSNQLPPALVDKDFTNGWQRLRAGYQYGYDGVVVTDPAKGGTAMGKGSYMWDGAAGTWFWVDPANKIVFVGMINQFNLQKLPNHEELSQAAIRDSLTAR